MKIKKKKDLISTWWLAGYATSLKCDLNFWNQLTIPLVRAESTVLENSMYFIQNFSLKSWIGFSNFLLLVLLAFFEANGMISLL